MEIDLNIAHHFSGGTKTTGLLRVPLGTAESSKFIESPPFFHPSWDLEIPAPTQTTTEVVIYCRDIAAKSDIQDILDGMTSPFTAA